MGTFLPFLLGIFLSLSLAELYYIVELKHFIKHQLLNQEEQETPNENYTDEDYLEE